MLVSCFHTSDPEASFEILRIRRPAIDVTLFFGPCDVLVWDARTEDKIRILREADRGTKSIQDLCREVSFHRWKRQFGHMDANEARRLKELERENRELRQMLADSLLKNCVLEALQRGDVLLDAPRPFLRVRAATTKNHKQATIFCIKTWLRALVRGGARMSVGLIGFWNAVPHGQKDSSLLNFLG